MTFHQMIGKTIQGVSQQKLKGYDDTGFLRIEFTDGSHITVEGSYGGFTAGSEDEYPTSIFVADAEREAQLEPLSKEPSE